MNGTMKKRISIFLAVMMCISLFTTAALAEEEHISYNVLKTQDSDIDVYYTIQDGVLTNCFLGGTGGTNDADIIITLPASVKQIGDYAFEANAITSIIIPDGVTSIGFGAFQGCSYLRSIHIPDSVTSIGNYAFSGCTRLKSISIPGSVTDLGECMFMDGCTDLESVTLGDGIQRIGESMFQNNYSLTSIVIPDSVTSIGRYAFASCHKLESIDLPDGLTSIGEGTFQGCSSLKSLTIPDSVTSIGSCALQGLSSMTSLTIPASVTSIGWNSFPYGFVIRGEAGSYAETYAKERAQVSQGVIFVAIDQPSTWAETQVDAAIAANIVPAALQGQYTQATTRAEFCALAVALYENVKGTEITERTTFNDTTDINVQKAAAIGVVSGVGNNNFAPNDTLTREQAATMLSRLAAAIGKPLTEQAATFADNNGISEWAFGAVGQVQANGVMGGVGNNTFAPKAEYTREQSIITMNRLFDIVK